MYFMMEIYICMMYKCPIVGGEVKVIVVNDHGKRTSKYFQHAYVINQIYYRCNSSSSSSSSCDCHIYIVL